MILSYAPQASYRKADDLPRYGRGAAYAALNRLNVLYMVKRAGSGHLGSSFSSMEVITWLMVEHPEIAFFSSKGHDAPAFYANLIGLGKLPFDMIHKLRRVDGLPGHPELKTLGIVAHSGSLGMGVSKAKGLIRANRLRRIRQRVIVLVGDGELAEGQNWEALLGETGLKELGIVVDQNGLGTEERPQRLDAAPAVMEAMGYGVQFCDGHNLEMIEQALSWQSSMNTATVIFCATVKGKGVVYMENNAHWHSGAPDDYEYGIAVDELISQVRQYLPNFEPEVTAGIRPVIVTSPSLVEAYAIELQRQGNLNSKVVVLDADLAKDCGLNLFRSDHPERFVECGIAEQDMVSQAGMLAAQGFIPIIHSFAAFLTRRANEQIYDNCHQGLRVIYVGMLAGRLPDGPGPSHEALEDVALMRTMPNLEILEPQTPDDVGLALHYAVNQAERAVYIRMAANPIERIRV